MLKWKANFHNQNKTSKGNKGQGEKRVLNTFQMHFFSCVSKVVPNSLTPSTVSPKNKYWVLQVPRPWLTLNYSSVLGLSANENK